ncbi:alanine racemase [Lichenifustis flavocetrariae]|uniref:Alanine racemase n=1 Tax=Lichenifustis flavocetrariae TaxID=2949735 RepID=A0AA41Z0D4_9HYPH|nr:alanine racemase [Lichenifustis flavocetrariae]MCW6510438.1 alanine racemase [Lichenifustis flavocetrariae]
MRRAAEAEIWSYDGHSTPREEVSVSPSRTDPQVLASAGAILTVDLAALRSNYLWLAGRAAPARCAAVVKADAYGLGASVAAPAFYEAGCRAFFVAHLSEGLDLRPMLPDDATIHILNGLQPGAEPACAAAGLVPVLNGFEQVEAWARIGRQDGLRLPAVLQIDSGMSRLGLSPEEVESLATRPDLIEAIDVRLVMSHLACADEPDHPANAAQWQNFERLRALVPHAPLSLANSGGVLLDARFRYDLARPGIALYGVSPTPGVGEGLMPVLRLDARVIQVRQVAAGTAVGYGATFHAPYPMRVATIAVGYADGWPRHLSNRGAAFFDGTRLPIVGRVSMDSITLDVTPLPEGTLQLGSLVELIGPHQTLDDVAAQCGTIPYEILTGLGGRYARVYLHAGDRPVGS